MSYHALSLPVAVLVLIIPSDQHIEIIHYITTTTATIYVLPHLHYYIILLYKSTLLGLDNGVMPRIDEVMPLLLQVMP